MPKKARPASKKKSSRHAPRRAAGVQTMLHAVPPSASLPTVRRELLHEKKALRIASIIFAVVALLHLARYIAGFAISVDHAVLPLAASGFTAVILGVLAVWYYRLSMD